MPRPVWLIGWVSFFTDTASEAIYPLLPFFLTQVLGAGAASIGIIEGAAEATNSLLKIWSGRMADRRVRKRPLVLAGYAVSSFVRPFISVAHGWTQVFAIRLADRVGKGVRGAPRDAMLATWASPSTRGRVFGFHRGMDHAGAVVGPVLAWLFLSAFPDRYRTLFALSAIPGAIAVALIPFIRENADSSQPSQQASTSRDRSRDASPLSAPAAAMPAELTRFFWIFGLFALGSSSDAFLLLRLSEVAGGARHLPLVWAALHVVKSSSSLIGGSWSDKVGRRNVITLGWLVYAAVYVGFALSTTFVALLAWFLIYGLYYGLSEGSEKALIADLAPESQRGVAFGLYDAVSGFGALLASLVFGAVWTWYGATVAFGFGAVLALVASALLFAVVRR